MVAAGDGPPGDDEVLRGERRAQEQAHLAGALGREQAHDAGDGAHECLLYLDQNYLSGIVKAKPAFRELEGPLRAAVTCGAVAVVESDVHERESAPRPDLGILELLRELSGGRRLPAEPGPPVRTARRRMRDTIARELPQRRARSSDAADLDAIAQAVVHCALVTCDAFIADVLRRTGLDRLHGAVLYTGRRGDVLRLRDCLADLAGKTPGRS